MTRTAVLSRAANDRDGLVLRGAEERDATAIHDLVVAHLAEGHLLPREPHEITLHAHRFVVAARAGRIVACADLAPLSRGVAEIRSLVVHPEARSGGLGGEIVEAIADRAIAAGFQKICAFTHAPAFFVRLGFSIVPHVWFPEKIATDCHGCSRFRQCGQYAVVRPLRRARNARAPMAALHG
jgi:amino-acid N-acetyltransferase